MRKVLAGITVTAMGVLGLTVTAATAHADTPGVVVCKEVKAISGLKGAYEAHSCSGVPGTYQPGDLITGKPGSVQEYRCLTVDARDLKAVGALGCVPKPGVPATTMPVPAVK
ncbi:hypothetical protein [Streptomyces sp. NPDC059009]|uniref:hypothetical protein n=1 Tax=Streptomyces sp. NPDC059009 TaxID=3346694 RepID=UPI0036CD46B8